MTSKQSTPFPAFQSTMRAPPQKDYAAAFGALQCQYGFGSCPTPTPAVNDTKKRRWYKWSGSCSSSTASLIPSTSERSRSNATSQPSRYGVPKQEVLSESELRLGKLMTEYGHGPQNSFGRQ